MPGPSPEDTMKLGADATVRLVEVERTVQLAPVAPADAKSAEAKPGSAAAPSAGADSGAADAAIQQEIQIQLGRMEALHDIRILLAVESGSRAWGFASPNSDWDVRFIYAPRLPWYLRVNPPRDVIELPISGDLDINGWELRKSLALLQKCNPTLLEWLQSPLIYRQDENVVDPLRALAREFFTPQACWHHYLSMAKSNNREYLQGKTVRLKKYLYVLRPLLCCQWIEQYGSPAPMQFRTLVDLLVSDAELRAAIDSLLEQKRAAPELAEGPKIPALGYFIETELQRCEAAAASLPSHRAPPEAYNRCDEYLRSVVTGA